MDAVVLYGEQSRFTITDPLDDSGDGDVELKPQDSIYYEQDIIALLNDLGYNVHDARNEG